MKLTFNKVVPEPVPQSLIASSKIWEEEITWAPNDRILVQAQSGKGKSTLLHLLYGLRNDYSGEASIDGQSLEKQEMGDWTRLRSQKIALLFQELRLFPKLSAQENITLIPESNPQVPTETEMAERLGMKEFLSKPIENLSFGQRQRIAIIRTLRKPFKLLLLDEPFSHLDKKNEKLSSSLIEEIVRANEATVLVTSLGESPPLPFDRTLSL